MHDAHLSQPPNAQQTALRLALCGLTCQNAAVFTCRRSISSSRFSEVKVVTAVTAAAPTLLPRSSTSRLPARHCSCFRPRGAACAGLAVRKGCVGRRCCCRLLLQHRQQ